MYFALAKCIFMSSAILLKHHRNYIQTTTTKSNINLYCSRIYFRHNSEPHHRLLVHPVTTVNVITFINHHHRSSVHCPIPRYLISSLFSFLSISQCLLTHKRLKRSTTKLIAITPTSSSCEAIKSNFACILRLSWLLLSFSFIHSCIPPSSLLLCITTFQIYISLDHLSSA